MDPYRTMPVDEIAEAPRDAGIVGDVIAQFADPNAFFRELVQNSIDAGSPSVDIRLEYDVDSQLLRIAVRDRGEGMTRDILENQLLVLFRSTKERDHSKIGKFGIGFASVLAPNPDVVIVDTVRDGHRLTLHLQRDLTYKLFDTGAATQTGTTVTLEIAMAAGQVEAFAAASETTLVRWCRHATVPIELTLVRGGAVAPRVVRIDRPLAIDGAIVSVRGKSSDGELVAVVAITAQAMPYTGFFNHGLTLYETYDVLVGRHAIKIQDSRLGHTLSRDNVRRDAAFDRALAFARGLALNDLPEAAARELRVAAEADDRARHRAIANSLVESNILLSPMHWMFPLVHPLGDRRAIAASALGKRAWISAQASDLTAVLASAEVPVLHVAAEDRGAIGAQVQTLVGGQLVEVERELTSVSPIEPTDAQHALVAILGELLAAGGRAPSAIVLARIHGAFAGALAIAGRAPDGDARAAYVVDRDQAAVSPFGRLRRPPLVLAADHAHVRSAVAADPRVGASLLARLVLLHYRVLDLDRSTALLAETLARINP